MPAGRLGDTSGSALAAAASRGLLAKAALLVVGGVSSFAASDALAKLVIEDFSAVQIVWARYAFFLLPLAVILPPWRWRRLLRTEAGRR